MNYIRNPKADGTSVQNLLSALKSFDVTFHVAIACIKKFAWTDSTDTVTVSANGKPANEGKRKIVPGSAGDYDFQINNILDMSKLGTDPITVSGNAEDFTTNHRFSASLAYPYTAKDAPLTQLDGHYTYSAFFK